MTSSNQNIFRVAEGNPPVTGAFSSQRPVTWSFDVFFDLRANKQHQAIFWTNAYAIHWRIYASLGGDEFSV